MNHASLCSGIGGFDLAAEWMGWQNVFAVEKDKDCQAILKKNFKELTLYDDVKEFKGAKYKGAIEIISAGFPCQPFSLAGKQKGQEDDRYLWPEIIRIIREIQPTFFVGENVPGIISLALDQVLTDLESEGYSCQTIVVPACAVNAVHRRDRVWIIAYSHANGEMRRSRINERKSREERVQERDKIQFSGKSSELSSSISPDTTDDRHRRRESNERPAIEGRELLPGEQAGSKVGSKTSRCSGIGSSSYTKHDGFASPKIQRETRDNARACQERSNELLESKRKSSSRKSSTNSDDIGLRRHERESFQEGSTSCGSSPPNQSRRFQRITYPISQPTICRGDDGISYRLDDGRLISSKKRNMALKQLGNAIVPQVAYEIFKIIDQWRIK